MTLEDRQIVPKYTFVEYYQSDSYVIIFESHLIGDHFSFL